MKNKGILLFSVILIVVMIVLSFGFSSSADAEVGDLWWHEDWPYRVQIIGDGSGVMAVNLDFSQLFSDLGLNDGLLDLESVRVIPYNNGIPGSPIPYQETYSHLMIDAETLNTTAGTIESYWDGEEYTTLGLDHDRKTQGTSALHAQINIEPISIPKTGFKYFFADNETNDWSNFEVLYYDVWSEVNQSAIDQTPDVYRFRINGITNCPSVEINGPSLEMDSWNSVSVPLIPFGNCPNPGLKNLEYLRFFVDINQSVDNLGHYDPGDVIDLWLDNFRLVDQDGEGEIIWQTAENVQRYYIYFDTLDHIGHPKPDLRIFSEPTISVAYGAPETGGYFYQIMGASTDDLKVWSAPITEKVTTALKTPVNVQPLHIHAARGEFEPIQLVMNSPSANPITIMASDLVHINGKSIIPAYLINLFRVDYVQIDRISNHFGRIGTWPDPLYPLSNGQVVTLPANKNQPIWIRIEVPVNAKPGVYHGEIQLGSGRVPYSLEVWPFALPQTYRLESLFGFDWDTVISAYKGSYEEIPQTCKDKLIDSISNSFEDYRITPTQSDSQQYPDAMVTSLTAYEIEKSHSLQLTDGEKIWWQFMHTDLPPFANPAVIDRPGLDARILPWLIWIDRVDGLYYPETADWDSDPWANPFSNDRTNGDGYLFYPPKDENIGVNPCSDASNRLVPSIRLELLREGLEDYTYFWLKNNGQPNINEESQADALIETLIKSRTAYTRVPTSIYAVRAEIAALIIANQRQIYLPLLLR